MAPALSGLTPNSPYKGLWVKHCQCWKFHGFIFSLTGPATLLENLEFLGAFGGEGKSDLLGSVSWQPEGTVPLPLCKSNTSSSTDWDLFIWPPIISALLNGLRPSKTLQSVVPKAQKPLMINPLTTTALKAEVAPFLAAFPIQLVRLVPGSAFQTKVKPCYKRNYTVA